MVVKLSLAACWVEKGVDVPPLLGLEEEEGGVDVSREMKRASGFEVSLWFDKICSPSCTSAEGLSYILV